MEQGKYFFFEEKKQKTFAWLSPAPYRAVVFAVWFYSLTTLFGLVGIGVRIFARDRALALARVWVKTVLAGLGPICRIHLHITGLNNLPPEGPILVASQHQSEFDTLIWMVLLHKPSYVMKKELTRIPLFGPLLVPAGMIPVDRAAGATALRRLLEQTEAAVRSRRQIVIFPEGTRVPHGQTAPLQPGIAAIAARLNLPVFPAATDSGRSWPRGVLRRRPGTIHLAIGPAIPAGTPRLDMLRHIESFWRDQEINGFAPVDKLVEQTAPITRVLLAHGLNSLGSQDF